MTNIISFVWWRVFGLGWAFEITTTCRAGCGPRCHRHMVRLRVYLIALLVNINLPLSPWIADMDIT